MSTHRVSQIKPQDRHTHLFLAGDLPKSSWTADSRELRPLFWDSWWIKLHQLCKKIKINQTKQSHEHFAFCCLDILTEIWLVQDMHVMQSLHHSLDWSLLRHQLKVQNENTRDSLLPHPNGSFSKHEEKGEKMCFEKGSAEHEQKKHDCLDKSRGSGCCKENNNWFHTKEPTSWTAESDLKSGQRQL